MPNEPDAEDLYQQVRDRATPLVLKITTMLEGEDMMDAALATCLSSLYIIKTAGPAMFGGWLSMALRAAQEHFSPDVVHHALIHCQQDVGEVN